MRKVLVASLWGQIDPERVCDSLYLCLYVANLIQVLVLVGREELVQPADKPEGNSVLTRKQVLVVCVSVRCQLNVILKRLSIILVHAYPREIVFHRVLQ